MDTFMDATPVPAPQPQGNPLTPWAVLILAGVLLYNHLNPNDAASVDRAINGVTLGKTYAPALAGTYGDAWLKAADVIETGGTMTDAQKTLQDAWKDARTASFNRLVTPGFALVLPEGTEPSDPAKRRQVAQLWRDFAKGLKGGK